MIIALITFDKLTFLRLVQLQQQKGLVKTFKLISFTGDGYLYPLIALSIVFLDQGRGNTFIVNGLLAFALELPLFILLKQLFKRDRPFKQLHEVYQLIQPSDKFSLPSGHSAGSFLVATLLAFYYPALAPIAFTWASLVGLSRIILGVHYPLDIILGAFLGAGCTFTSILVINSL